MILLNLREKKYFYSTRLLGRIYSVEPRMTCVRHFNMKQNLKLSLLALCFLSLSGCNILELVRGFVGVYEGRNRDGQPCEVQVSFLDIPSGLCRWATVSLSTNETTDIKRFCLGSTETYQPTRFFITQGSPQLPQQALIENNTVIDFQNQNIRAVTFLDKKKTCRRLERK